MISLIESPVKRDSVYFVSCPKQGLEIAGVVPHRGGGGGLEYIYPNQCKEFKP